MPLAESWQDDFLGKPPYLQTSRSRTQALKYGYYQPEAIRHTRQYYATIEQMDASIGRMLQEFLYEIPNAELGARPLHGLRTER